MKKHEARLIEPSAKTLYMLGRRAWSKRQVYDRARLYFELAAQKGHVGALCALAFLYANGYGVEQDYDKVDYDKARELSEQSAGQGHAESQFRLGYLYYFGQGDDQDHATSNFLRQVKVMLVVNLDLVSSTRRDVMQNKIMARKERFLYSRQTKVMPIPNADLEVTTSFERASNKTLKQRCTFISKQQSKATARHNSTLDVFLALSAI